MPVADTSVLLACFDDAHDRHREAIDMLSGVSALRVPTAVLAEFALVLRRVAKDQGHDGNAVARRVVGALMAKHEVHEHQVHDGARARRLYARTPGLSYVDAVAVVTAWGLDEGLLTLDARQRAAWAASV